MDPNQVVSSVRRYPIIFGLIGLLGLVLGALWAVGQPSSFEATSRIVIGPAEDIEDPNDRIQVGQVLNHPVVAANLSELLTSDRVVSEALQESETPRSAIVDDGIEASVAPESNVVQVKVTSLDPDRPVALITPLTESGVALFEDIYNVYRAEIIDLDIAAEERKPPSAIFGAVVGLIGGLIMAVLACLFVDGLNSPRSLATSDDAGLMPRPMFEQPADPELFQQASMEATANDQDPAGWSPANWSPADNGRPSKLDRAGTLRADPGGPLRAEASYPVGPGSGPEPEPVPAWPYEPPMTDVELRDLLQGGAATETYDRESSTSSPLADGPSATS